jgi:hypothetical protein
MTQTILMARNRSPFSIIFNPLPFPHLHHYLQLSYSMTVSGFSLRQASDRDFVKSVYTAKRGRTHAQQKREPSSNSNGIGTLHRGSLPLERYMVCSSLIIVSARLNFGTPSSPLGTCCKMYDGRNYRRRYLHTNIRKVHFSWVSSVWAGHSAFSCICIIPLKYVLLTSATISVLAR